ncbi:MAG: hypothetical protein OD811_00795 [Alphaproteobacteria bacterium]
MELFAEGERPVTQRILRALQGALSEKTLRTDDEVALAGFVVMN